MTIDHNSIGMDTVQSAVEGGTPLFSKDITSNDFNRDYWSLTAELGEELQVMDSWTVEEKVRQLKHKRSKYANTV